MYETNTNYYLNNMVDSKLNGTRVRIEAPSYTHNNKEGVIVGILLEDDRIFYIVKYDVSEFEEECGAWYLSSLKFL
jgi:hypothetical protein